MSFASLATVGTLSYNGYTFDGSSQVSVRVEFVMDDAQRTILYHRHIIHVRTYVQNDSSTDASLETIRALLGHQGQALTFINKGFGDDLIVNAVGGAGLRDVKWGPKPRILAWNSVGSAAACEVEWEVETCVPKCSTTSSGRFVGVMAMNYEVAISIDNRGLSTRTVSGYLEIAQTRNGHNIPDSADAYRHLIAPPQPDSFKRNTDWRFSSDRSRVEFSITDAEIPSKNAYPLLCTNIDGSHRCSWSRGSTKASVRNTISFDIETTKTAPPLLAYTIFGNFVRQRMGISKSNRMNVFLDDITVDEDIFGLRNRFSCSYRSLFPPSLALNAANPVAFDFGKVGVWAPVNNSWSQWKASLSAVFSNRGMAGLAVPASNDVIIDLCEAGVTIPWFGTIPPATVPVSVTPSPFKNERPDPEKSYLKYRVKFATYADTPTVRQAPQQQSDSDQAPGNMFDTSPLKFPPRQYGTPDTIQKSGPARYSFSMMGFARRAGYPVPRPKVLSVGGQTPVERSAEYYPEHLGDCFGVPVYEASWVVNYMLPSPPSTVDPPVKLEA